MPILTVAIHRSSSRVDMKTVHVLTSSQANEQSCPHDGRRCPVPHSPALSRPMSPLDITEVLANWSLDAPSLSLWWCLTHALPVTLLSSFWLLKLLRLANSRLCVLSLDRFFATVWTVLGLQVRLDSKLLSPRDFSGKNTDVSCHFLLQGISQTQGY